MRVKDGKSIFIADDRELFRIMMGDILTIVGHKVRAMEDGQEVINELDKNPEGVDLLVLDLHMEGNLDGFGVLDWMKSRNRVGNPPVLVITGAYSIESIQRELKEYGVNHYLSKETSPGEFVFEVNKILYDDMMRRERIRVPANIEVDFSLGDKLCKGTILDLSESGVFIYTNQMIETENDVKLHFLLPGEDEAVEAAGTVKWIDELGSRNYGIGVHFSDMKPITKALIMSFIAEEQERIA